MTVLHACLKTGAAKDQENDMICWVVFHVGVGSGGCQVGDASTRG